MVVKADVETFFCVEHHALPGMCVKFDTSNGLFIGTDWDTVYYNLVVTDESVQALVFDMSCSDNSNNIYIKNVECTCSEPLMLTSDSISSGSAVKDLDFVDMGSGIRWATHNVGALRGEGNGLYVGWELNLRGEAVDVFCAVCDFFRLAARFFIRIPFEIFNINTCYVSARN